MNSFEDLWKVTLAIMAVSWLGYMAATDSRSMGGGGYHRAADAIVGLNGNSEKSTLFALPFAVCGIRLIGGDDGCID